MPKPSQEAETRAIAFTGMALSIGVISRLERKGVLTADDVDGMFEAALSTVETMAPDDASMRIARQLLDMLAGIAVKTRNAPKA